MFFGDPATEPEGAAAAAAAGVDGGVGRPTARWRSPGRRPWTATATRSAGYNLYRRLSTEESYTKLNTALIAALTHTDTGLAAAAAGATYYYALSAVDSSSDESVKSAPAAVTIAASGGGGGGGGVVVTGGGGGGGGCFISAAGRDLSPDLLMPLAAMALLCCLIWISRRRRG